MVNSKDLKIGNLVKFKKGDGTICKIDSIYRNTVDVNLGDGLIKRGCSLDSIEGVKFNRQVMKNIGFRFSEVLGLFEGTLMILCEPGDYEDSLYHNAIIYINRDMLLSIEFSNEEGEVAMISMPKIQTLHQLQNLQYDLNKEELIYTEI